MPKILLTFTWAFAAAEIRKIKDSKLSFAGFIGVFIGGGKMN
jgi:hypothetical protein